MAGLYIHIPYCHSKCAYCDFYSMPRHDSMEEYVNAIITEMQLRKYEISPTPITTIYIGGGTPSILPLNLLEKVITEINFLFGSNFDEFTIETNPEDITIEWVKGIIDLGINRVSMGIQSFSDIELKAINRRHSSQQSLNAIEIMRNVGISNISGDLIFGLPLQDIKSWEQSLDKLLSLQLPHFSAYLLSYEPGTKLYAQILSGKIVEASEEMVTQMYQILIDRAKASGYQHYEISNYALPQHRAIHNSNYWNNEPYIGLGASAHSFDGKNRRYNPSDIKLYLSSLSRGKLCYIIENESEIDRYNDMIITRLRTSEGIDLQIIKEDWSKYYNSFMKTVETLVSNNKIIIADSSIYIPENQMLLSDAIMREFIVVDD